MKKVREDKEREVKAGHDGTWVAHPALVSIAKAIFDEHMKTPNQIAVRRPEVHITAADLLAVPEGNITDAGLKLNIDVGIQYLESWLMGNGCVPIYNLMEDAATAEISRTQVWQWLHNGVKLQDGRTVTADLIRATIASQLDHIRATLGEQRYDAGKFPLAAQIFERMMTSDRLFDFLTLEAYDHID